jgi:hypothetical protein
MREINPNTKTYKLYVALRNGDAVSAAEALNRFNIRNIRAEATRIRQAGYAVYANRRVAGNHVAVTEYVIGTPSREIVAAGYRALADQRRGKVVSDSVDQFVDQLFGRLQQYSEAETPAAEPEVVQSATQEVKPEQRQEPNLLMEVHRMLRDEDYAENERVVKDEITEQSLNVNSGWYWNGNK